MGILFSLLLLTICLLMIFKEKNSSAEREINKLNTEKKYLLDLVKSQVHKNNSKEENLETEEKITPIKELNPYSAIMILSKLADENKTKSLNILYFILIKKISFEKTAKYNSTPSKLNTKIAELIIANSKKDLILLLFMTYYYLYPEIKEIIKKDKNYILIFFKKYEKLAELFDKEIRKVVFLNMEERFLLAEKFIQSKIF